MLKRLDNHLSRCHRGVTRAYNDCLRTPILQSRKRVTCLLPGCFKQVLHFSRHLKNLHLMTIDEYHSKVAEVNVHGTERAEEQVSIEYVSLIKAENLFQVTKRAEQNKHTKRNILFQDHINDFQLKKNQEKEEVLAQDSELSDPMNQESACNNSYYYDSCIVTGGLTSQHQQEEIFLHSETHACEYDEDYLRFLVHNTSAHGIQFFLTAMRESGGRLVEFQKSRLCRAILGVMPISTLKDIYLYRMYLTSFYRQASYYPYPDKSMILKCLACCVTKKGTCVCPILPSLFMYSVDNSAVGSGTAGSVLTLVLLHLMYVLIFSTVKDATRIISHPQSTSHTLSSRSYFKIHGKEI